MIDYNLKDKVVLITGTNNPQGIGATTAYAFAREGAKLILVYKRMLCKYDESKADVNGEDRYKRANALDGSEVECKLEEINADYILIESDISDKDNVKEIYEKGMGVFGKIDILVNNAADCDDKGDDTIELLSRRIIDDTYAVNVRGTVLMIQEFIKHKKGTGRVINLSTDAAQMFSGQIIYGSSKAAIEALTRSIALEVARYGVTVNCVSPGPTQTGWIDKKLEAEEIKGIPLGRLIKPEDIADTILFLASDRASQITGQVIKVSGGHAL